MRCPACSGDLASRDFEGHYGRRVGLDLCVQCEILWFDPLESVALTPGAILELFEVVHAAGSRRPTPLPESMACPRCRRPLALTSDRQRNTPFEYWACPAGCGRLEPFTEFLREKDFVRPISPQELADLRARVRTVTCSGCGAPVDLAAGTRCVYCRAPLSLLDPQQVERALRTLHDAEARREAPPDTQALVERLGAQACAERANLGATGLLQAGFGLLLEMLSERR